MPFESDTISDEKTVQSQLENLIVETIKKFDAVTFNQDKSSFILQNISIILAIKSLESSNDLFKNWFANAWDNDETITNEEQSANFYKNLNAFILKHIDPFYETYELSHYVASNEDNYSLLSSIVRSFINEFSNDKLLLDESTIEIFLSLYLTHLKTKKDFLTFNISSNASKFLLLNSLKKDLDELYKLFLDLDNNYTSERLELVIDNILSYRVLDPITFSGSLLSSTLPYFNEFYDKILKKIEESKSSKEYLLTIFDRLFGRQSSQIDVGELQSIIALRHLYGIVPDNDLLLLTKLNLYISLNYASNPKSIIKTNLHFNIIKGNLLLGFEKNKQRNLLNSLINEENNFALRQKLESIQPMYQKFVLTLESSNDIKTIQDDISKVIRDEYLKELSELKIKSDLQERLAIVNPLVDFIFLKKSEGPTFSLVIGIVPNKVRLTITFSKIMLKQYYDNQESIINVINLYTSRYLDLVDDSAKLAVFMNRNVLYHGEYTELRKTFLENTALQFVIDFGDYKYQRTKHGVALVITENKPNSSENTFVGINLLSLEQEQKEQLLVDYSEDYSPVENVLLRKIIQNEFLEIQGNRFYIKKPSKWFEKFSSVPTTLHEYIESIESGFKVGENKVLYISDQKVKELQLEATLLKNALKGKHFHRYSIPETYNLIIVPSELPEDQIEMEFPNTWKYLVEHKEFLESRPQVKKKLIKWYQIADAEKVTEKAIKPPKLLVREKSNEPVAVFDTRGTLQLSSTFALRFTKQIRFRDYFKVIAWFNSLVVKAGYLDLTQDSKTDAQLSLESIHDLTIPLSLLKDDQLASNIQQIVQMCLANKFSFNPHLLLLDYPEGQFHPEVYNFLFDKIYAVLKKKMKNLLDKTIKISDIAIIEINQPNKKKKVDEKYLYPIFQDYKKSILVLQDGDIEITMKLKPRQAYTLPFLQLFLAYQPKEMIVDYLKQYTKPESLEEIVGNWPIPELQMKHVMETFNFVRFQRQNFVNFFNRTKKMLTKVETMVATHYGFTPEEIEELFQDRDLIEV